MTIPSTDRRTYSAAEQPCISAAAASRICCCRSSRPSRLPLGSRRSRCMTKWPCARRMARRLLPWEEPRKSGRTLTQTQGSEMSMQLHRRTVLKGMLGSVSALALKAPAIAQSAPFKIGLLTVKTGPLAQGGIQMEQGIATLLKEKNNTLAGRKVELLVADT